MSKKKTDIWMPLYIAEYLGDTMHLTTRQHGAYLLLIMAYWRNAGPLPSDDRRLAAICRLHQSEWAEDRDTLAEFFETESELWHHKRIDIEMANALENVQKASDKGKAGAAKRWQRDATGNATGMPQAMPEQCPGNASSPSPSTTTNVVVVSAKALPATKNRGSRLSKEWALPKDWGNWALQKGLSRDKVITEAEKFRNYWIAKSGRNATKLDWEATWQNWVIKAIEDTGTGKTFYEKTKEAKERDADKRLTGLASASDDDLKQLGLA